MNFKTDLQLLKVCLYSWAKTVTTTSSALFRRILPFHASAWSTVSEPIQNMLSASDLDEQNMLTALWRDNTQNQLNFVCITSALMGGVIASAFTWPALEQIGPSSQVAVQAIWYSALLFGVVAIATATQQAIALARICSYPDGLQKLRNVLGKIEGIAWRPRPLQLFIWQTPAMLLNASIYTFVLGLTILVWSSAAKSWPIQRPEIVIVFTLALTFAVGTYIITSVGLYHRIARA